MPVRLRVVMWGGTGMVAKDFLRPIREARVDVVRIDDGGCLC